MKKITFKVSTKKEESVVSLIKKVNNISCRIQIDLENGFIAVENVDDDMLDSVIELIDQYYNILNIMIDNISDKSISVETSQSFTVDDEPNFEPTVVGPQSKDDLIIQKVKFENKYVEDLINKLMKTAYWAMYKMNVSEKVIGNFIWSSINEISMSYNNKKCIEYSVGDVVDCEYGMHLVGEVSGGHVSVIICNINDWGMAYVVPITKIKENLTSLSYITFDAPNDIFYKEENYLGGTVLLDKGRYLRDERFHKVIGKVNPEFFAKVLTQLSITFDFTGNIVMNNDTKETIYNENVTEDSNEELISADAKESNVTVTEAKPKKTTKKASSEEAALLDIIGESIDKLDPTKEVEEQVETFLTEIGMVSTERMVTLSFVIACDIKKISYENVILELHNMFPKLKEDNIKSILKENFKKWLNLHPELVESYPKISFMAILKVFAKRFIRI